MKTLSPPASAAVPRPDENDRETVADIERRLRLFAETGDPMALWPKLTEAARVAASRELERVTAAVLADRAPVRIDAAGTHSPYALAIAGHTSGMGPVVGRWIEDGTALAAADVARVFADHLRHARLRAGRIEGEIGPPLDALLARGVVPVVLKGFHTNRTYFEEPAVRRMSDVDLLVRPAQVADAESALRDAGFEADGPSLRPYKRDWIGPGVDPHLFSIELAHERSKWAIELHASLDRIYDPGAVAKLDVLRAQLEPFEVDGRSLLALSPTPLVLTLACHCSQELDGVRLLRLYELVRIVRAEVRHGRLDWDAVLAMLARTRAARFTYPAFALVNQLAPGTIDPRVIALGHRQSTWASRHTVARLVPAGGSLDARGVVRQWMWTRGAVAIGQRLLRNVWPAAFSRPEDVGTGWRVRLARLGRGVMSLGAPDERQ